MIKWLKAQDWYWSLYYEYGIDWFCKPDDRIWRVLVLPGEDPPPPRCGWKQKVTCIHPLSEVVRR